MKKRINRNACFLVYDPKDKVLFGSDDYKEVASKARKISKLKKNKNGLITVADGFWNECYVNGRRYGISRTAPMGMISI